jgi:hypothetical protein
VPKRAGFYKTGITTVKPAGYGLADHGTRRFLARKSVKKLYTSKSNTP